MNVPQDHDVPSTRTERGPGRLGAGLTVDGDIITGEDLVLEGRLNGGLHAPDHMITIAASGVVHGKVFARMVIIEGSVHGDVTATNLVEIGNAAKVEADVNAPAVSIAQGAFVVGKIDMRRADAAARVARYRLDRGTVVHSPEPVKATAQT